ncbi:MAG: hypothetical protein JAY74_20710 [Candidatus Thiodiazotropha taylori]|nr:hypothetical protein [Candidatus Thiodiazotropha taylori]
MAHIDSRIIQVVIGATVVTCLFLENVLPGVHSIWVQLPLVVIYIHTIMLGKNGDRRFLKAIVGYLIPVIFLMLYIHIQWYFDIHGAATGGSTSALIFAVLPVYCFIVGAIGYVIGYAIGND